MVNFGIVGLGRIGKVHLSNVQRYFTNARVIAACSNENKHEKFLKEHGVNLYFDSLELMLKTPDIDAVIIASPTAFHFEHIHQVAQARKHIFCEKPIDLSLEKVINIKETVDAAGIRFMLGFNRRFDPHIKKLKKALDQDQAGRPRILKITSRDPEPPPLKFIQHSGGLFLDMTIHDFDIARFLVEDEVVQVMAYGTVFGDSNMETLDDIDTAVVTLIFKNGCMVQIDNSRYCPYGYDQRIEVFGEKGKIATQNILEDAIQTSNSSGHHTARAQYFFIQRYAESYRNALFHFVQTLENGQSTNPGADDSLAAMTIALAAKQSIRENRPITLPTRS